MGIIKDVILHDQEAKKQEPSKYDEALAKYNTVREAVRKIIAEKVPQNDTEEVKKFLFGSIELTTLKTTDSETSVLAFTERVNDFDNEYPELPHVATICVYPCFAKTVAESLEVDGVEIACVSGSFPSSQARIEVKVAEASLAVADGATEIDIVMPVGKLTSRRHLSSPCTLVPTTSRLLPASWSLPLLRRLHTLGARLSRNTTMKRAYR